MHSSVAQYLTIDERIGFIKTIDRVHCTYTHIHTWKRVHALYRIVNDTRPVMWVGRFVAVFERKKARRHHYRTHERSDRTSSPVPETTKKLPVINWPKHASIANGLSAQVVVVVRASPSSLSPGTLFSEDARSYKGRLSRNDRLSMIEPPNLF